MTITALLEFRVTPEALATAPAVIHDTLAATRAFAGNMGVEVVVDIADPTHFVVIEQWESLEADEAYRAWRSTPEGGSDLGNILAGAPSLTKLNSQPAI
jgi:heme oxygenase (mycobilin-producing)